MWIPVYYEEADEPPVFLMWKEGEEYIRDLAKYTSFPIAEGFLIYQKKDGTFDGFLAQLAFDPLRHPSGTTIDRATFTGSIMNADWEDNLLKMWTFEQGKLVGSFDKTVAAFSRVQNCTTYYSQYGYVTGSSCGMNCHQVTYHSITLPHTICLSGSSISTGSGGDPYYSGSGGGSSPTPSYGTTAFLYSLGHLQYDQNARQALVLTTR